MDVHFHIHMVFNYEFQLFTVIQQTIKMALIISEQYNK